jgi:peptidoglycan hydrolase CwlO-like protein
MQYELEQAKEEIQRLHDFIGQQSDQSKHYFLSLTDDAQHTQAQVQVTAHTHTFYSLVLCTDACMHMQALKAKVDELTNEIEAKHSMCDAMQSQCNELTADITKTNQQLRDKQADCDSYQHQLDLVSLAS